MVFVIVLLLLSVKFTVNLQITCNSVLARDFAFKFRIRHPSTIIDFVDFYLPWKNNASGKILLNKSN